MMMNLEELYQVKSKPVMSDVVFQMLESVKTQMVDLMEKQVKELTLDQLETMRETIDTFDVMMQMEIMGKVHAT